MIQGTSALHTYKWLLSSVTDTSGNVITYTYDRATWIGGTTSCQFEYIRGTADLDAWPTTISWGRNLNVAGSVDRYKVTFDSVARENDTQYEWANNQYGKGLGAPRETRRLRTITVTSYRDAAGGTRSLGWDAENRPASITASGVSETYGYDADGERVTKTAAGATTIYLEGLWEEVIGGAQQAYYVVGGQPVAVRTATGVTYLHGDHLGSVGLATDATGNEVSRQEFDPWGKVRSGSIPQTSRNYTGQTLDGTGLLYYHARYYDPAIARFLSADTIVPGAGALTVAPSDATAAAAWAAGGGGPANPQALNRYSYAGNNPVRNTDPTGHCLGPAIVICAMKLLLDGFTIVAGAYLIGDLAHQMADNLPTDASGIPPDTEGLPSVGAGDNPATNTGDAVPTDLHVFPSGGQLRQRPGKEYELDDDGMVIPQNGRELPTGQSTFGDVSQAPLSGKYEKIPAGTQLPDGVGVKADGREAIPHSPHAPTHHTLFPKRRMTPEDWHRKVNDIPRLPGGRKRPE